MKVSEAKTKVCPFIEAEYKSTILSEQERASGIKPIIKKTKNINCICGDCMAWVYTKENEERAHPRTGEYQKELEIIKKWEKEGFSGNGEEGNNFKFIKSLKANEKEGCCKRLT